MEYSINSLAKMAGITTRTLRYYDSIELLKPKRINSSGYRIYGEHEVDRLQEILFFKELGLELETIAGILENPEYNSIEALRGHLFGLQQKRAQLDLLINTVDATIKSREGGEKMSDSEKFIGLKEKLIAENEQRYGEEIRTRYGEDTVTQSNRQFAGLTEADYEKMQALAEEINSRLEEAVKAGESPESERGHEIAEMHKKWLGFTWIQYSKEAHRGLGEMYVADERFTAYYDKNISGAAAFLRDALNYWMKD